jgi:hypothetical protein
MPIGLNKELRTMALVPSDTSILSHSRTYPSPALFHESVYLVCGNIPIPFSSIPTSKAAVLPTQLEQPTQSHTYTPASIQHSPTILSSTHNHILPILHIFLPTCATLLTHILLVFETPRNHHPPPPPTSTPTPPPKWTPPPQ